jgi:hypothetical protein
VLAGIGGLALLYADARSDLAGLVLLTAAAAIHLLRVRRAAAPVSAA